MIKALTTLEISKETRKYQLILSPESPLGECFDVLTEMRAEILQRINAASQSVEKDSQSSDVENSEG